MLFGVSKYFVFIPFFHVISLLNDKDVFVFIPMQNVSTTAVWRPGSPDALVELTENAHLPSPLSPTVIEPVTHALACTAHCEGRSHATRAVELFVIRRTIHSLTLPRCHSFFFIRINLGGRSAHVCICHAFSSARSLPPSGTPYSRPIVLTSRFTQPQRSSGSWQLID